MPPFLTANNTNVIDCINLLNPAYKGHLFDVLLNRNLRSYFSNKNIDS